MSFKSVDVGERKPRTTYKLFRNLLLPRSDLVEINITPVGHVTIFVFIDAAHPVVPQSRDDQLQLLKDFDLNQDYGPCLGDEISLIV